MHSARIIDVAGPKSPSGSRSPSADAADRIRRASLTIPPSGSLTNVASAADAQAQNTLTATPRPVVTVPKSRSPVDAMRGSVPSAATISESDEEGDRNRIREQRPHKYLAYQPSTPTVPEAVSPTETKRPQGIVGAPPQSPVLPQSASAQLNRNASRNEKVPTSPTHSIGMVSIERSKTRDSDEEGGSAQTPRPTHTSGSSASSGISRLKAVRTSEDNGSRSNVARNFEELIQSNQTITYTLTPENMRNMDVSKAALFKWYWANEHDSTTSLLILLLSRGQGKARIVFHITDLGLHQRQMTLSGHLSTRQSLSQPLTQEDRVCRLRQGTLECPANQSQILQILSNLLVLQETAVQFNEM